MFVCYRDITWMLWYVAAMVPWVFPGDDNGQKDSVPNRDVYAMDPHRPYTRDQGAIHDGVSVTCEKGSFN